MKPKQPSLLAISLKYLFSTLATAILKKPLLLALSTTVLIVIVPVICVLTPSATVAQSTRWCQCTEYVASRFGLGGYPNAGDWDNGYLAGKGFRQINYPQNGAIVVLNPNTAGAFGLGHIGIVEQYTTTSNSLKLNIRGTNQPGANVTNEFGCNNVTIWSNNTNVANNSGVTYWIRTSRQDGALVTGSGPEVYIIQAGQRRWIPNPETFNALGLNWNAIQRISDADLNAIPLGQPLPSRRDGALLTGSGPEVYIMQAGQRRWIPNPETFNALGLNWNAIQRISDADLNAIPLGQPLPSV